jgi:hypothetical protein
MIEFSTDDYPPVQRFEAFREFVARAFKTDAMGWTIRRRSRFTAASASHRSATSVSRSSRARRPATGACREAKA